MRTSRFLLVTTGLIVATILAVAVVRGARGRAITLLVTGGTVVTMDGSGRVIPNGAVAIDHETILDVGTADDLARKYDAVTRIDARGQIVLPGLINAHTHAPMVLFRGLADDLALKDWLEKDIFPAEAKTVSPDFVRIGTRLAALEMIESGTTTFADMYYFEDDIAQAVHEAGLRAVLGQSVIRFPVPDAPTPAEALKRADAFIQKWKSDPLITPAVAPHAPHTVDAADLQAARALANRYGVPLLIHLAETQDEVKAIQAAHQMSPAAYLDSLGVWNGRSLAAHAVWLDDHDMTMLAARHVGLAHNPASNMKLASGVAAVQKWLDHGILAGLGTDGAASSNDLDMFEAMRLAALLQKVSTLDPRALPARQTLELATRRGAQALGLDSAVGSLEPGKQADLITVSVDDARQTPMFDPISHLVYVCHGDDVQTTIVAGRVLMRDRRVLTLDKAEVLRDARAMAERVARAVAAPKSGADPSPGAGREPSAGRQP
jgi:5-methylthioadenosine/S-adenosylhomocysteine deaminase